MHLFSKENIYKDDVYANLSHWGCPPLLVTYWVVNHRCREQVGSDLGSGLPSLASWWTHGDQGGIWVMVKGFSRGRSVVLKSWSVLVLSSSNNQMPAKVLWTSPNEAHSAHRRDEQPGPTTLLSTAIWLPFFFFIFRASEEMNDSPSCSLWLLPAKKESGSTIHLGAEQPALEQAECPREKYIPPLRQCLRPCVLTTEISPNRCADFCDLTVCIENSFSEHPTPPLDVGLLFCTTDCGSSARFLEPKWASSWVALCTPAAMGVLRPLMGC